MTTFLTMNSTI